MATASNATDVRVLLVEDNPGEARLFTEWLSDVGIFRIVNTTRLDQAILKLKEAAFDVAVLDLSLPDAHGLDALHRLHAADPRLPIVVLSGRDDETLALEAVRGGAQDYLIKGQTDGNIVRRALEYARERKRLERALAEGERRYRDLVDKSHGLICMHDLDGNILYANPAAAASLGRTTKEIVGVNLANLLAPHVRHLFALYLQAIHTAREHRGLMQVQTKEGKIRIWSYSNTYCEEPDKPPYVLGHAQDVTELRDAERALRESEERFRTLASHAPIGIFMTDTGGACIYTNDRWSEMTGLSHEAARERNWLNALDPLAVDAWQTTIHAGSDFVRDFSHKNADGKPTWLHCSASPVHDSEHQISGYIGTIIDVTDRKTAEDSLRHLSLTDELTGLYNRRGFLTICESQIKLAQRAKREMSLFFVDLDGMKQINDRFGHAVGDQALADVAKILKKTFRDSDIIARLGGDEFAVLILECTVAGTQVAMERLQRQLINHNTAATRPYSLAFSIGTTHYLPTGEITLEQLMERADTAMYEQKRNKQKS